MQTNISPLFDFGKVQRWRAQCEGTHGDCCTERYSENLANQLDSLLLVDVVSGNLVTMPTSTRFVALSYVWGNTTMLKCVQDNVDTLKQDGVLFNEPFRSALAATIRDAFTAVKRSGERYLWVDCLSVTQDSGMEEMDKILRAMAHIYASAEFTIVAAQGETADSGLPRVNIPSIEIDDIYEARNSSMSGYPSHSRWARRGWTFQESLFSRRLLVFHKTVSWICGRHIRLEQEHPASENSAGSSTWPIERPHLGVPMGIMSLIPNKPSLGRWGMIVENFSSRELTYEQDHVRALAGATQAMSTTFPGGLYKGLPLFFFDIALLWQPSASLQCRYGEPSWSWQGWMGAVDCLSPWDPFYAGLYRKTGSSTDWMAMATLRPLATWSFKCENEHHVIEVDELNGFYSYQALRHTPERALPRGWKRHSHPQGDYFSDDSYATTGFRYSYPRPTVNKSWTGAALPSTATLSCTAPAAMVTLGVQLFSDPSVFSLMHNELGIGCLTINSVDRHVQPGDRCRLVAISWSEIHDFERVYEHSQFADYFLALQIGSADDESGSSREREDQDNDFYNVLWVDEQDGISYREGLGMVSRRFWDGLGAQIASLELA